MIRLALFGKGDIFEKLLWCKKYAGAKDERDRIANAMLKIRCALDAMINLSDAALDTAKIRSKLTPLELTFPNGEELDLFTGKIIKNFGLNCLFSQFERVPGRPDYEYGFGFFIETYNIFFEDKIHEAVDVVQVKKKMGLFTEKQTVKEKKVKTAASLFGEAFKGENFRVAVTAKEKDNRDNIRYGIRLNYNVNIQGQDNYIPDEVKLVWKDERGFLESMTQQLALMEAAINRIYTVVGYDDLPEFTVLLGEAGLDRKIGGFSKEVVSSTAVIDTQYE